LISSLRQNNENQSYIKYNILNILNFEFLIKLLLPYFKFNRELQINFDVI